MEDFAEGREAYEMYSSLHEEGMDKPNVAFDDLSYKQARVWQRLALGMGPKGSTVKK